MNPWRRNPFFRIVIPFVTGIVFAFHRNVAWAEVILFLLLPALAFALLYEKQKLYTPFKWLKGLLICAMLFSMGAELGTMELQPSRRLVNRGNTEMYIGKVVDTLSRFAWGQTSLVLWYPLEEKTPHEKQHLSAQPIKARTLFTGEQLITAPGDKIAAAVVWENPGKARFQGEFDEESFMRSKGLFIKARVREGGWMLLKPGEKDERGILVRWIERVRMTVDRSLKKYLPDSVHTGVMKALLIGDRSEIPPEVSKKLAGAGITHVLAVSGLHVGIVYWLLGGVLNLFFHGRMRRWFLPPVLILCLAGYVLLTGSSPSVLRAAVMLSLILLAKAVGFRGSTVNTVLFTGFVILVMRPHLFFNLGFQLSFLAVLGILWIYPLLKMKYYPRSFIARKIADMVYVSIAAQLATTIIAIAYFQIFPTYFLLSNLLIAPLLILALYSGIALVVCSMAGSHALTALAGNWITGLLSVAFNGVDLLEKLPNFVITGLYIPHEQLLCYLITTGTITAALCYHKLIFFKAAILSIMVIGVMQMASLFRAGHSADITCLRHRGSELLVFRSGRQALAITGNAHTQNSERLENDLQNYRRYYHLSSLHRCGGRYGFRTTDPRFLQLFNPGPAYREAELMIIESGIRLPPPVAGCFRTLYISADVIHRITPASIQDARLLLLPPSTTHYQMTGFRKKVQNVGFEGEIRILE